MGLDADAVADFTDGIISRVKGTFNVALASVAVECGMTHDLSVAPHTCKSAIGLDVVGAADTIVFAVDNSCVTVWVKDE